MLDDIVWTSRDLDHDDARAGPPRLLWRYCELIDVVANPNPNPNPNPRAAPVLSEPSGFGQVVGAAEEQTVALSEVDTER